MSTSAHGFPYALVVYVAEFFKEPMVDSAQCTFDKDRSVVPVHSQDVVEKYFGSTKKVVVSSGSQLFGTLNSPLYNCRVVPTDLD